MFWTKEAVLVAVIFSPSAVAQSSIFEELGSMEVLVTEVADSCQLEDLSFESKMKVSNRAFHMSESGNHEEAITCYLSLLESGEPGFEIYDSLSISFSKAGRCEEAQESADKWIDLANEFWSAVEDQMVAEKGVFGRDWTDFSDRWDVFNDENVEDPQRNTMLAALEQCESARIGDGT